MSQPKPWERTQSSISSTQNVEQFLNRSASLPVSTQSNIASKILNNKFEQNTQQMQQNNDNTSQQLLSENNNQANLQEETKNTGEPNNQIDTNNQNSLLGNRTYGSSPYSSSMYSSPYGGGMYGGMGGMYGGMGGMYGGGMYGRGMYGGMYGQSGLIGNSQSYLEKMNMYVYQLCEIAQMVEFNANGLHSFYSLLKNLSIQFAKFGKDWIINLAKFLIKNSKAFKDFIKKKFHEYFVQDDLDKETLQTQINFLQVILKGVLVFITIHLLRILYRVIKLKASK